MLTQDLIETLESEFRSDRGNIIAMNAVAATGASSATSDWEVISRRTHTFSHEVRATAVTDQKQTGRCWAFAGLNILRGPAMNSLNLETFELSQSYLMFFDKLEKSNFFMQSIIDTESQPLDGRLVQWLLSDPITDAGQWDMFVNLVERYGVVPKSHMPESWSSSRSRAMNELLSARLRTAARDLRVLTGKAREPENSADSKAVNDYRRETLADIYRILCIHLGIPPRTFHWQWRDKSGDFRRDGTLTPKQFYDRHISVDLSQYACVINAPSEDKEFGRTYTVEYLGNVVNGREIRYLNLPVEELKRAAIDSIVSGEAVWFGCDVSKMLHRQKGILDTRARTDSLVYGAMPTLDKARRLAYGDSRMTHAMVLTGVDLDENGTPLKWRVENSWGDRVGNKGFFVMSDEWFDEHVYEITVADRYLSPERVTQHKADPVRLPPWDPMGALARERADILESAFDGNENS